MPSISQFELYNQPLVDDPNSADMIIPMMTSVTEGTDISDSVKSYIFSQLGRRDIHKFQNLIENGDTPTLGFPRAGLNLMIKNDSGYMRIGHLRIIDWVDIWMMENLGYVAYAITSPESDPATLVGIAETPTSYIPVISYDVGAEEPYRVIEYSNVEVPKPIPEGVYVLEYVFTAVGEPGEEDSESHGDG